MGILLYFFYLILLIFSFIFLIFFYYTIYSFKEKGRIPTVYIYIMIFCNFGAIFVEFVSDVLPAFISEKANLWFWLNLGTYLILFDDVIYEIPIFLTILMVTERLYAVIFPFGKAFSNKRLWMYSLILTISLFGTLLIPFLSECRLNFDFYTFDYVSGCEPEQHPITDFYDSYNILFPLVSLFFNIILIVYLYLKRRNMQKISIARRSHEKTLLIQSIATTSFLLIYEITEHIINFFSTEYETLPDIVQRIIYLSRVGSISLLCFLVYFVGTPAIRQIIIYKAKTIGLRRRRQKIIVVPNTRDSSALF